ncbi:IMP dehydrogenase [Mycoplasma sp. SG1]|uniref:IMP dehydrogenase n=1 Tax=Mycoplasma sp. SG1 TaxID=2810348 RepID=UPI002025854D|nr:IMP dehydrogenase [Mycoplasma sp. SG1]URM52852.1 IMP dehydrogenase [Mycoplasma sp. SG1]
MKNIKKGLTFNDLLLVPKKSNYYINNILTETKLTKNIILNIPIISAAMSTITTHEMAIEMAKYGGIGIIHKNLSIKEQAYEVDLVKKYESGMIKNPLYTFESVPVLEVIQTMQKYKISGLPVVKSENDKKLIGIITNRDIRFLDKNTNLLVKDVCTKNNLITANPKTSLEEAKKILHKNRIEKLILVDSNFNLAGLITIKDIEKKIEYPNATLDNEGRLRVGAAVSVSEDTIDRIKELIKFGADVIVLDSAHAHSSNVLELTKKIKIKFPKINLIVGNVATKEAAIDLIKLNVDAIKVGMGPGSICTTRVIAGIGVPQATAIMDVAEVCKKHNIPVIADGGIRTSGDITKAIGCGASSVMLGNLLAGTDEAPGEITFYQGQKYKSYYGMGSIQGMKEGGADRYFQSKSKKFIAEGVKGFIPYKGPVSKVIYQLVGGLKSGMGYCGCENIPSLQTTAEFLEITNQGIAEGNVHDLDIVESSQQNDTIN